MKKSAINTDPSKDSVKISHEHGGKTVEYTPPTSYDESFSQVPSTDVFGRTGNHGKNDHPRPGR